MFWFCLETTNIKIFYVINKMHIIMVVFIAFDDLTYLIQKLEMRFKNQFLFTTILESNDRYCANNSKIL